MRDNVVPLFPHVLRDIEKIVERQDNLVEFRRNIEKLAQRNWRQYRGEAVFAVGCGGGGFNVQPTSCCVCSRKLGTEHRTDNAFGFWTETNGDFRVICVDDYRRYWYDQNEKSPA